MKQISYGYANGRINLLGEHLDYNYGCVIPLQIDRGIKIEITLDSKINGLIIKSNKFNDQIHIDKLDNINKKNGNWSDFILGCCLILNREFNIKINSLKISVASNLPMGVGLSSSAAVCIATLRALSNFYQINISGQKLVSLSHSVENNFVEVGGGLMDQFTSVFGDTKRAMFLNTKTNKFQLISIPEEYKFLIIDSGEKRILSESNFNQKKEICQNTAKKLNLTYLCEESEMKQKFRDLLSKEEIKIATHVITENQRSLNGKHALLDNDLNHFGELMTESHQSLTDNYEVSTPELNQIVKLANGSGALGSKLTGAGYGGAVISLIKKSFEDDIKKYILKNYSKAKFI